MADFILDDSLDAQGAVFDFELEERDGEVVEKAAEREKNRGVMWRVEEPSRVRPTEDEARDTDGKIRLKDCYRQAGRYVMMRRQEEVSLIHGTINIGQGKGEGVAIAHAWAEVRRLDGTELVYDGVQGRFYDRASYYRNMRAAPERTYAPDEARVQMLRSKHFGPWHTSAGI